MPSQKNRTAILSVVVLFSIFSMVFAQENLQTTILKQTNPEDGFWQKIDPKELGLNSKAIEKHRQLCLETDAHATVVIYKGKIVSEWYAPDYKAPLTAMSSTKSVASMLVGLLVDEGKLSSVDEPVHKYIPEWSQGDKKKVTIRHLLTHTSGFKRIFGKNSVGYVREDKNAHVISLDLTYQPGTTFDYSNEGVQLLSPVLDKIAGMPIQQYAQKKLFQPLGMNNSNLKEDEKGHAWTYADMETTPRDFARLGLLMLQKGIWKEKRILSNQWIHESTQPTLNSRCGYLWWLYKSGPLVGYASLGYQQTNMYIFPKHELIVVRMQNRNGPKKSRKYEARALFLFQEMLGFSPVYTLEQIHQTTSYYGDHKKALEMIESVTGRYKPYEEAYARAWIYYRLDFTDINNERCLIESNKVIDDPATPRREKAGATMIKIFHLSRIGKSTEVLSLLSEVKPLLSHLPKKHWIKTYHQKYSERYQGKIK
jgi:CubicO group peptidase (beta-lactamase class C family)